MSDEINTRLKDSTEKCLKAHEAWSKDKKSASARENLQEAVHELRKVASRLEIEIAVSERDSASQKPMPIPQNRNAKGKSQAPDDNAGNKNDEKKLAKKVKLPPKKSDKEKAEEKSEDKKPDDKKDD
ncbi:MAG: hypothetical protein AAF204_01080 [Pseudomonadota bacterium]